GRHALDEVASRLRGWGWPAVVHRTARHYGRAAWSARQTRASHCQRSPRGLPGPAAAQFAPLFGHTTRALEPSRLAQAASDTELEVTAACAILRWRCWQ